MIMREGALIIIAIVAALGAVGYGYSKISKQDDAFIEEYSEELMETTIENALGLPDDSLNIDLTPSSKEDK